jgi:hypothetical protein
MSYEARLKSPRRSRDKFVAKMVRVPSAMHWLFFRWEVRLLLELDSMGFDCE